MKSVCYMDGLFMFNQINMTLQSISNKNNFSNPNNKPITCHSFNTIFIDIYIKSYESVILSFNVAHYQGIYLNIISWLINLNHMFSL